MCNPASGSTAGCGWLWNCDRNCGRRCGGGCHGQPGEIGNSCCGRRGLSEFQSDLYIAAIEVELGDLILLEELDQFPQILHVLWFHSFLFCLRATRVIESKFDQCLGCRRQHLSPGFRHGYHIFDANAELARPINSGFNGNNHSRLEPCFLSCPDSRRLVNLKSYSVPCGMGECVGHSGFAQDATRSLVHLSATHSGSYGRNGRIPGPPALPRRRFVLLTLGLPRQTVRVMSEQ